MVLLLFLFFFFCTELLGFAPRKRQRNGNPSWGAPGYSVRQKETEQRGKTRGKKDLPRFFLFETLPYLKCKVTSVFLIYFSPYFWLFLSLLAGVGFLLLQFLIPCPALILVWENFSVAKGKCNWVALVGWTWKTPFSGWGKPFYFTLSPIPFSPGRAFSSKQRPGDIPGSQLCHQILLFISSIEIILGCE